MNRSLKLLMVGSTLALLSPLNGVSLIYEFTDATNDEPINTFYGDVASGIVEFDNTDGSYTVTWHAANNSSFLGPMRFDLHLINIHAGNVVSLVGEYTAMYSFTSTFTYSDQNPGLVGWAENQTVLTSGSLNNTTYISGIYSLDMVGEALRDRVEVSRQLKPGAAQSPGAVDTDGDGLLDDIDQFDESDTGPTVFFRGVNTWIPNQIDGKLIDDTGHTLADLIFVLDQEASENPRNHGQYVQQMVRNLKLLAKEGKITQQQFVGLIRLVVES